VIFLCEIANYFIKPLSDIQNGNDDGFNGDDLGVAKNKIEELQYWIAGELSNLEI